MKIRELVIASHNQGKIDEIRTMLAPYGVTVVSARDLNLPDVEETGATFKENAELKAVQLSDLSGKPCLADDSGLCVDALGGRPGVYSARYAERIEEGKVVRDFDKAIGTLVDELKQSGSADWSAHFSCVLAFKVPEQNCRFFEGRVDGKIVSERSGNQGFGFDPVFVPNGFDKTFANFSKDEKAAVSHRGRAFEQFIKEVFDAD
ncbi:MAG: RdgB/HAM1 family non-canonical purine NTP pyrophosphatase [Alphaproteobacteria bacterium]|nr:RdgB/HAM1 family non-canonical purine NTP pyrophosphatase [Alphaproteobacteria bacterium]MBQ7285319.1 RdgB/HAM1 family non-canonical purine NTP pyrophosphatase [Alphaproteobacteria bacterium]